MTTAADALGCAAAAEEAADSGEGEGRGAAGRGGAGELGTEEGADRVGLPVETGGGATGAFVWGTGDAVADEAARAAVGVGGGGGCASDMSWDTSDASCSPTSRATSAMRVTSTSSNPLVKPVIDR